MDHQKKPRCEGLWTEARYWSFISSGLRRMWVKYPVRSEALKAARRPYLGCDKRTKWEYKCNNCKEWFKGKDVHVDHIEPVGSLMTDLMAAVQRLFCELGNLQVVCKSCHKSKTNEEK